MDRDKLATHLVLSEGLRLMPYRDTVGKLTIGVGRNLDDVGISESEAYYLLDNDITKVIRLLDAHLPWWRDLDEVRQRVLAEMAFNMGVGNTNRGLLSFRNTLRAVEGGRWNDAAVGMISSLWAAQVGNRARRLATMMRTGMDTGDQPVDA